MDFNITEACLYAGISRDAYYDYIKVNPEFATKADMLRSNLKMQAKKNISAAIQTSTLTTTDTSKWYLERRAKDEFSNRQELTGADGKPMEGVIYLADAPDAAGKSS